MIYQTSATTVAIFSFFVALVLGLSFYLGRKAKSAQGYFAAHGGIPWFVNGIAFAGDYLSAASFLGICGIIAFYGYDGFLYSIGYLAGWIVALFVIAEPLKRLGRFTFADALDKQFNSRAIKLTAAISTLVVSMFYLIPQMVGAGALVKPLLGFQYQTGVLIVGIAVVIIVVTAGMVSTTWVQFIKGSLLVFFCTILTVMILQRGFSTTPHDPNAHVFKRGVTYGSVIPPGRKDTDRYGFEILRGDKPLYSWYARDMHDPAAPLWRLDDYQAGVWFGPFNLAHSVSETQTLCKRKVNGVLVTFVNGKPQGKSPGDNDLYPVGGIASLPGGQTQTGPVGPISFFSILQKSTVITWAKDTVTDIDGTKITVFYQKPLTGQQLLTPGNYPSFGGVRKPEFLGKLNFLSLMLALFCGTASLPHILIRYYTVKDQSSVRKSTVVGIAAIGFFYVLTLYMGLGAATSGALDPTDNNMAAPLLARSFNPLLFAIISAIAFTTVLGTVSGLIMAASGAVAHDLMTNFMGIEMDDRQKVRAGKIAAVIVGLIAIWLGIQFEKFNVTFLVAWAFNVAASANLPSLIMLLFWKRTTRQGIAAAITVGLISSVGWILLSSDAYTNLYMTAKPSPMPFNQPAIVTIPLGFLVLVIVSLLTPAGRNPQRGFSPVMTERKAIEDAEQLEAGEA